MDTLSLLYFIWSGEGQLSSWTHRAWQEGTSRWLQHHWRCHIEKVRWAGPLSCRSWKADEASAPWVQNSGQIESNLLDALEPFKEVTPGPPPQHGEDGDGEDEDSDENPTEFSWHTPRTDLYSPWKRQRRSWDTLQMDNIYFIPWEIGAWGWWNFTFSVGGVIPWYLDGSIFTSSASVAGWWHTQFQTCTPLQSTTGGWQMCDLFI